MGKGKFNNIVVGWLLVVLTVIVALTLSLGGLFLAVVGILHVANSNLGNALFFFGLFLIALGILSFGLFNAKKIIKCLKNKVARTDKEGK